MQYNYKIQYNIYYGSGTVAHKDKINLGEQSLLAKKPTLQPTIP